MNQEQEVFAFVNTAHVIHERSARYGKQLISHWKKDAERVETDGALTTMYFLPGKDKASILTFDDRSDRTVISINTKLEDHGKMLVDAVQDHLVRFAGKRDQLTIDWVDTP